jgi:hypothetical protein
MAKHRIVCTIQVPVTQPHDHAHIVRVGTGSLFDHYSRQLTVAEVYAAIDSGDEFYTFGVTSGTSAAVHKYRCPHCHFDTLRSAPDAVKDNNLDSLPTCP